MSDPVGASVSTVTGLMVRFGATIVMFIPAGCSTARAPTSGIVAITTSTVGDTNSSGEAECNRSPITTGPIAELEGSAGDVQLHGLVMAAPITVGKLVKIVWRMTGSGPLTATATDPDGQPLALEFGPTRHLSSNYNRPGDEWGTGYLQHLTRSAIDKPA